MTLIALSLVFLLVLAADGVSVAEGIATGIAGVVAPILAQVLKRMVGVSGLWALLLSVAVSAAIAVASMYMAGAVNTFGELVQQAAAVFGIATVVYKLVAVAADA